MDLQHCFDATIDLAPAQDLGTTPAGHRRLIPIIGGHFAGPRLRGRVLPGGADWQVVHADGTALLEARYALETDDGALIQVRNVGYRHGPPEVLEALARGEDVPPDAYYFRTTPWLETGAAAYAWLNRTVFVASGARRAEAVVLQVHAVT